MSLKPVSSAGEENCLTITVRLVWELSQLGLATLCGGGETLLGEEGRLDGVGGLRNREKAVGEVLHPDEGRWDVCSQRLRSKLFPQGIILLL
jgi:hypothetical protein